MKKNHSEAGYTLIGVILIFAILTVLGISLVTLSMASVKTSSIERENQTVYYVAEAGLNFMMNEIEQAVKETYEHVDGKMKDDYVNNDDLDGELTEEEINENARKLFYDKLAEDLPKIVETDTYENFEEIDGEKPKARLIIEQPEEQAEGEPAQYSITSIGELGKEKRRIEKVIEIAWRNEYGVDIVNDGGDDGETYGPPDVLHGSEEITVHGGKIDGNIATRRPVILEYGGTVTGNVLTMEHVDMKGGNIGGNVVANKKVTISGGNIGGFVQTLEDFSISNGNVTKDVMAMGAVSMTGGTINGNVYTSNTFSMLGGGSTVGNSVFSKDSATITGGTINGDLLTGKTGPNSINITGGNIRSNIFVPSGSEANAINQLDWMKYQATPYSDPFPGSYPIPNFEQIYIPELPKLPKYPEVPNLDYPTISEFNCSTNIIDNGNCHVVLQGGRSPYTLTLDQNYKFDTIKVDSNRVLNIDLQNGNRTIVVDKFDLNTGHINLVNPGKLTIFITDEYTSGSGSFNETSDVKSIEHLNVYYGGENKVVISSDMIVYGSLYAKTADIEVTGGGGYRGNIFTGGDEVSFSGGTWAHPSLIFAPNALFKLSGGAQVTGAIMVKDFTMSGGGGLTYEPLEKIDSPISWDAIDHGTGGANSKTEVSIINEGYSIQEKSTREVEVTD